MPRAWYNTDRARALARRIGTFFGFLFACWILSFLPVVALAFHTVQGSAYQAGALIGRASSRLFAQEDSLSAQLNTCANRLNAAVTLSANSESNAREVQEWRALMGYQSRTSARGVAARVIARDTPEESMVTIDQGANNGIQRGSAVVVGDGVLFGIIDSVSANSANVRLTEDPKSTIPATILGNQTTIGLVTGQEGALLAMEYIPQDTQITVNDIVVTSGLGGRLPQGIVIGTVTNIVPSLSAPFVTASISPVHDPREWNAVFVLPYPENLL